MYSISSPCFRPSRSFGFGKSKVVKVAVSIICRLAPKSATICAVPLSIIGTSASSVADCNKFLLVSSKTPIATILAAKMMLDWLGEKEMGDKELCDALWKAVKEVFKNEIGDNKYFSVLPKNQMPPVDLNKHEMEKWRPLMDKFYVKEKVKWQ